MSSDGAIGMGLDVPSGPEAGPQSSRQGRENRTCDSASANVPEYTKLLEIYMGLTVLPVFYAGLVFLSGVGKKRKRNELESNPLPCSFLICTV